MRILQSANPRPLNLLAVGPGGLVVAASDALGAAGDVEAWDSAGERRPVSHPAVGDDAASLVFGPGCLLIGVRYSGQVVALELDALTRGATRPATFARPNLAASGAGPRLLVVSTGAGATAFGAVECWAVEPGPTFRALWQVAPGSVHAFGAPALTPDGRLAATAYARPDATSRPALSVRLYDAATGRVQLDAAFDPASPVRQLAFTADASKLLVRTDGRTVHLFDATTGDPAGELVHRGQPFVTAVAAHPSGAVACARTDGTVTVWEPHTRAKLQILDWKAGRLASLAFSPDGALGAAGTEDGKVVVWDVDL